MLAFALSHAVDAQFGSAMILLLMYINFSGEGCLVAAIGSGGNNQSGTGVGGKASRG